MQINITHNVGRAIKLLDRLSQQFPFAAAKALTTTVQDIAKAMPEQTQRTFEGGAVQFTKAAFTIKRAEKTDLTAMVKIKPRQAEYLRYQIEGGLRRPKRVALRLPSVVEKTPEGNLPAGLIRQLVARAKAGKSATKRQSERFKISHKVDLFYGDPKDGRPAGIYKRAGERLIPIVVFPRQSARYERKFDFFGIATRVADKRFPINYANAWALAVRTAR